MRRQYSFVKTAPFLSMIPYEEVLRKYSGHEYVCFHYTFVEKATMLEDVKVSKMRQVLQEGCSASRDTVRRIYSVNENVFNRSVKKPLKKHIESLLYAVIRVRKC